MFKFGTTTAYNVECEMNATLVITFPRSWRPIWCLFTAGLSAISQFFGDINVAFTFGGVEKYYLGLLTDIPL